VYDLVDRPRKGKDAPRPAPAAASSGSSCGGGGGGCGGSGGGGGGCCGRRGRGGDVEAPAEARGAKGAQGGGGGSGGGGGCCKGGGACWPWRRRHHRPRHVAWPEAGAPLGARGGGFPGAYGAVGGEEHSSTSSSVSSSGFGSDTSSNDGAAGRSEAGGAGSGAAGERRLLRSYGHAWRDDDAVQAALEGWQHKLHRDREALVREWQDRVAPLASTARGGGGGGGGGNGASRQAAGAVPHAPSSHARSAARTGVHVLPGAAAHLGAKHRRRVRLRSPLQAPFYAYATSGRSLGRKKVMLEQVDTRPLHGVGWSVEVLRAWAASMVRCLSLAALDAPRRVRPPPPPRRPAQVSFFVCPDGVLISLFQKTGQAVAAPIFARLKGMQSLLVDSEDTGVLLQVGPRRSEAAWVGRGLRPRSAHTHSPPLAPWPACAAFATPPPPRAARLPAALPAPRPRRVPPGPAAEHPRL
jgi:hypothetical protein